MRRLSMATRDEILVALEGRDAAASREEKGRLITELAALTGYHRKHAARVFGVGCRSDRSAPRPGRRRYDEAVRAALIVLWEASGRICGKRVNSPLTKSPERLCCSPSVEGADGAGAAGRDAG